MQIKIVLLLCAVVLLAYLPSLNNGFILDDKSIIVNNLKVRSLKNAPEIFTSSLYNSGQMYRPMQVLSYAFDYKLWGLNPFGFHLGNVILHILNVILVFYLLNKIYPTVAFGASLIFAVHPINTSVVSYISGRADLLVTFFMLSSLALFQRKRIILSILLAIPAYFCRENSLILFLLIILISATSGIKLRYCIPFIFLSLVYLVLRLIIISKTTVVLDTNMPFLLNFINYINVILNYIVVLVLPLKLHLFRSVMFIADLIELRAIVCFAFVILSAFIVFKLRKNKLIIFSICWFIITLSPVFFILDSYLWLKRAIMAESWLYLPAIGFFILIILIKNKLKIIGTILLSLVIVFYISIIWMNNIFWHNNILAYQNILENSCAGSLVRKNLIKEYLQLKLYDCAFQEIKKFSKEFPESSDRYILQGDYYLGMGATLAARESFKNALRINRFNIEVINKLKSIEGLDAT